MNILDINPMYIETTLEYQNVNKDIRLRENITNFYHKKAIKWANKNRNLLQNLDTPKGFKHIYNILRVFVKKYNVNWYNLKDNYYIVKEYIIKKLAAHN